MAAPLPDRSPSRHPDHRHEGARRVLVLGDANTWGRLPVRPAGSMAVSPSMRHPPGRRWPEVMAERLGVRARVVVDALPGRTVGGTSPGATDAGTHDRLDALRALRAGIAGEPPLDLVVLMLGTDDLRSDRNLAVEAIAAGIARLVAEANGWGSAVPQSDPAPRTLVVVPPFVGDTTKTPLDAVMAGAPAKSGALAVAVRAALAGTGTPVIEASRHVMAHGIDGVHLTAADHETLGVAIAAIVGPMLRAPAAPAASDAPAAARATSAASLAS